MKFLTTWIKRKKVGINHVRNGEKTKNRREFKDNKSLIHLSKYL